MCLVVLREIALLNDNITVTASKLEATLNPVQTVPAVHCYR